ncbi:MAG: 50S ribosomal protein L4 [Elusimicrobia bacterium]|nr:50S ribosomal protein L4 [Elusimicrobiota bacterium]
MEAKLLNIKGQEVGKLELKDAIFGQKPSSRFLHEFITVYLANQRRGTAHTKTRSEVSGGGKKPWKQKHTGRARAGSIRSPLWRHGGTTFGPRSGKVYLDMPRQKSRAALAQALAARHSDGGIVFIDEFSIDQPKTKVMAAALKQLGCAGRTLVVLDHPDADVARASRNIPDVELRLAGDLNAYEVLRSKKILITRAAMEKLGTRTAERYVPSLKK